MPTPTPKSDIAARLSEWFAAQLPDADDVRLLGFDRVEIGHSAETLLLSIVWRDAAGEHRREVAIRIRPPVPGLLEPYDFGRQVDILRGLETTAVRAPRVLWFEATGEVLGREFYVMERLPGQVYERVTTDKMGVGPEDINRMCNSYLEQVAAIHNVDLQATGLHAIADGHTHLDRELEHWGAEVRRVQRGPLPAIERLIGELGERKPEQCPRITLVHGDPKVGNVAFVGTDASAVFDWEMATIGDPRADIGWIEVLYRSPGLFTSHPGAPTADEFVARWEKLTGITAAHRPWHRAFQAYKTTVIMLVAGHLYGKGHTRDRRFLDMAHMVHPFTQVALRELGIDEPLESGPVVPDTPEG